MIDKFLSEKFRYVEVLNRFKSRSNRIILPINSFFKLMRNNMFTNRMLKLPLSSILFILAHWVGG